MGGYSIRILTRLYPITPLPTPAYGLLFGEDRSKIKESQRQDRGIQSIQLNEGRFLLDPIDFIEQEN
jgi:hypothetical protein